MRVFITSAHLLRKNRTKRNENILLFLLNASMSTYLETHEHISRTVDTMKDEEILRGSLKEPALFEVLVERYHEPLLRAAKRVVHVHEEAEDIVQEAFVKMYKHADRFEKLVGIEFKSWAYKITINTAITHYRRLKRGEFVAEDPSIFQKSQGESVDTRFSFAADAKVMVSGVLEKMPPHLQSVLKSYYFEDKSYRTIAKEQHISIPTLKMRLFRAKKVFKKLTETHHIPYDFPE
ncbi:MAG: RNA polymerase sigma factor SigW [Parcubacteria group bacterium Gr01-1014_66]|nr:MAG: RNA polymerase sigma factor SigW [Parcubacteria group bacterium Gr01-1014_66]